MLQQRAAACSDWLPSIAEGLWKEVGLTWAQAFFLRSYVPVLCASCSLAKLYLVVLQEGLKFKPRMSGVWLVCTHDTCKLEVPSQPTILA